MFSRLQFGNEKQTHKICIWSVALYGSEIWTLRKNEDWIVNEFETWWWGRRLKIKWIDGITKDEVFQRRKKRILLKINNKIDATRLQGIQLGIPSLW